MIVLSVILAIIASAIMIAMGYIFPYIALQYYALKQKTTVKSLISLVKKYGDLSNSFFVSRFLGYALTIALIIPAFADLVSNQNYKDIMFGCVAYPILLFAIQLYWVGGIIKNSISFANDCLHEQPIKI